MIKIMKATLIVFIMTFLLGASSDVHYDFPVQSPSEFTLPHELLNKKAAIFILGAIDYYVEHCNELTVIGVDYRNYIIFYHDINTDLLPINPGYIKGALSISIYDCNEIYEMMITLDISNTNLAERPIE
jgi:hypothetical protein